MPKQLHHNLRYFVLIVALGWIVLPPVRANVLAPETKQKLHDYGQQLIKDAPANIKNGTDLDKAAFCFDNLCLLLANQNITVNADSNDRKKYKDNPEAYTCGDLAERMKSMFAGAGIKSSGVIDVLGHKDIYGGALRDENINHDSIGIVYGNKIYLFDPWQHAVHNGKLFNKFQNTKWRGMPLDDWLKEMANQGYKKYSTDEGLTWYTDPNQLTAPYLKNEKDLAAAHRASKIKGAKWVFTTTTRTYESKTYNVADYSEQTSSASEGSLMADEIVRLGEVPDHRRGTLTYEYQGDIDVLEVGSKLTATAVLTDGTGRGSVTGWIAFQPEGTIWNLWSDGMPTLVDLGISDKNPLKATGSATVPSSDKSEARMILRARVTGGRTSITYDRFYKYVPAGADAGPSPGRPPKPSFAGQWKTAWGIVTLRTEGNSVMGTYPHDQGKIRGTVSEDGRKLVGKWLEGPTYKPPKDSGPVEFTLSEDGKSFKGYYWYGAKGNHGLGANEWSGTKSD
ncbi:MAG: hypothetical protein WCL39_02090 [Armatimonadota bacterium]